MIERKNATMGLDRSETKDSYGRTLYRVVALVALPLLGVAEGERGGWCSDEAVVGDRVQWVGSATSFWGGTFRGGTFEGGTFWGGTFRGGTFWGGTETTKQPLFLAGLRWNVTITDMHMTIGCQHHELVRWWSFSDAVIRKMDSDALEFWNTYKPTLQALCAATGRTVEGVPES